MSHQQSFNFVNYMTRYGSYLGGLIGLFASVSLAVTWFDLTMLLPVVAAILIAGLFGGLIGSIYGGLSGFASGLVLGWVTKTVFHDLKHIAVFKFTVGAITVGATLIILLIGQFGSGTGHETLFARTISPTEWTSLWIMALVFALYGSQRVAEQYLLETDDRLLTARA